MCACLAEVDTLTQEVPGYILEGFTRCLVVEFKVIHKLLNTANKVYQMRAVSGKRDSNTTLAAVQKLCSKANAVFHSLNLTNKGNIPQGHQANAFGNVCYNVAPRTIPVINVLFHAMKQKSQRPKRLAQSQLLKDAGLVVVVLDADVVMFVVAVGVTVQILGERGVPIRVILLLPVQMHLWVMESKSKMESG
jgi:hypothetical protein